MKKKNLIAVLLLALSMILGGCGNTEETKFQEVKEEKATESVEETTLSDAKESNSSEKEDVFSVNIEEQVILEKEGVKVTVLGCNVLNPINYIELDLMFTNSTDSDIAFKIPQIMVNGYITDLDVIVDESLAPGTEEEATLYIATQNLINSGMSNVGNITISLDAFAYNADEDPYGAHAKDNLYFHVDDLAIKTSAYDNADTELEMFDNSNILLDRDGIRIRGRYAKYFWEEDGKSDRYILVCIENNSEKEIRVCVEDSMIDGQEISIIKESTIMVPAGHSTIDYFFIEPAYESFEDLGITDVAQVTMSFVVKENILLDAELAAYVGQAAYIEQVAYEIEPTTFDVDW